MLEIILKMVVGLHETHKHYTYARTTFWSPIWS